MKYYIKGNNKSDFYHVGTDKPILGLFVKARGWEFLMAFLIDFPSLLENISIIDENDKEMTVHNFIKNILKTKKHDLN